MRRDRNVPPIGLTVFLRLSQKFRFFSETCLMRGFLSNEDIYDHRPGRTGYDLAF